MQTDTSSGINRAAAVSDLEADSRQGIRRQILIWFDWMDSILDTHRNSFVLRPATPAELAQHKKALRLAIRYSHLVHALIADPDFNAPDLVSRLKIRQQQLQDAYDTFHDSELSDEEAERILKQTFPE